MKKTVFLLLTILLAKTGSGQICHAQLSSATEDGQCDNNPYVLVFEDNFDGSTLDLSKWQIQPWGQGSLSTDHTQQYYTLDNVSVSNGICSIITKNDTVLRRAVSWMSDTAILSDSLPNLRTYYNTSSNIWTHQKFGYGIYEIRCRIPKGHGFWPAFWMYGENSGINNEIDVFEFWDHNTVQHHMTSHYNGMSCSSSYSGPDYSLAFHTYKVIWDKYKIEWYVDSVLKKRLTKYNTLLGQNVLCDGVHENNSYILEKAFPVDSMSIIANVAIQAGTFAPDTSTIFPDTLQIDYIRYYAQLAGTGIAVDTTYMNCENMTIKTYPNPVNGMLYVEFEKNPHENMDIYILDEQGRLVFRSRSGKERTCSIDISGFGRGVYILHIRDIKLKKDIAQKVIFN